MLKKIFLLLVAALCFSWSLFAQDATQLVKSVKAKLDKVKDYTATGVMKTDVVFIKAPVSKIRVYYKAPNRFRLKKDGGISLLPKGGISVNMSNIVTTNNFTVLDAGNAVIDKVNTHVVKLLPNDENSDVVLSTLYIDEANFLIKKAVTTTVNNGTYDITLNYGKFADYGLPDRVIFSFNTKDYKLPKGITMEMGESDNKPAADQLKNKKGKIEIFYNTYAINTGFSDDVFK